MRTFLVFAPYILVPLCIAFIFNKFKIKKTGWTYVISGLIILIYPFVLFWMEDLLNPPLPGIRCGNAQMGFLIGSLIMFLPVSELLKFILNKLFLNQKIKS